MKKSLRVLALILAVITAMSSMSAMASAYSGYKGSYLNSKNYDDANDLVLSTEQYASMAMDELDRMLSEEFSEPIDLLGMATLELYSVDKAIKSASSLVEQLSSILGQLGDATLLETPLKNLGSVSRSMTPDQNKFASAEDAAAETKEGYESDLLVLYTVLDLLGSLGQIVEKYASGDINLGLLDSMASAYYYDIRELAISALIKVAGLGDEYNDKGERTKKWDVIDDMKNIGNIPNKHGSDYLKVGTEENGYQTGILLLATDVLKGLVLGDWVQLGTTGYEWYSSANKTSKIVYDEYYWKEYVRNSSTGKYELKPITDPGALDMETYEYWGYVHPKAWVTFGLGDAVRIKKSDLEGLSETDRAEFRAESYTAVDLAAAKLAIKNKKLTGYDFIENLIVQAYNGIAVPVLNRKTVKWLREEAGYKFLDSKNDEYLKNDDGSDKKDANGEKIKNPDFDYYYMGEDYKDILYDNASKLYDIFNVGDSVTGYIKLDKYDVTGKTGTFIDNLHSTLKGFFEKVLKVKAGESFAFGDDGNELSAKWTWVDDNNATFTNACSLVKFVLKVTGNEFFDKYAIDRGEIKNCAQLDALSDMELLTYLLTVILNSSIDWFYLKPSDDDTLVDVGYALVEQMAYQDIPQFTFNKPTVEDGAEKDAAYTRKVLDEALLILANIGVYNLNQDLDMDQLVTVTDDEEDTFSVTNNGTTNETGLLSYVTDATPLEENYSTRYGMILAKIGTWAINKYGDILQLTFESNKDGYDYTKRKETDFWKDLDTIINNIIPIYNDPSRSYGKTLINEAVSVSKVESSVLKEIIFQYIALPILNLDDTGKIFKLFERGNDTAFSGTQDFEAIIVDILHLVFELLFPGVFNGSTMTDLDTIINNVEIGKLLSRLLSCLGAHTKFTAADTETKTGIGKDLLKVALPIVCSLIGLDSAMEFGELENYISDTITESSSQEYILYNGSTGINTSYFTGATRIIDDLYTIKIVENPVVEWISGKNSGDGTLTGVKKDDMLVGGESKKYKLSDITAGNIYNIKIFYNVYSGETPLAQNMLCSKYVYVGSSTSLKGTKKVNGCDLEYTTDYYLTGGLGGADGWTFTYKNTTEGNDIKVTEVTLKDPDKNTCTWFGKEADYTDADNSIKNGKVWIESLKKATYVLSPFKLAEDTNAVRQQYVYVKSITPIDANATVKQYPDLVDPITGLKYIDHVMTEKEYKAANDNKDVVWLKNGTYTLETKVKSGGDEQTITQYIHFYEDYGLENLFNNEVGKNYTSSAIKSYGLSYFLDNYTPAIKKTAGFVLTTMEKGLQWVNPEGNLDTSTSLPQNLTMDEATAKANKIEKTEYEFQNKYQQYYAYLKTSIKGLQLETAGTTGLYDTLDAFIGMTRYNPATIEAKIFNKDGKTTTSKSFTMQMPESVAYNDANCKHEGMRNYMAHAYNMFRDARDAALDLIDRDETYHHLSFKITQDEYDAKWAEYNKANDDYAKAKAEYDKVKAEYDKDKAEQGEAEGNEHYAALTELMIQLNKLDGTINSCKNQINSWNNSFVAYEAWTPKTISAMEITYASYRLTEAIRKCKLLSLVGQSGNANDKLKMIVNKYDKGTDYINSTYTKTSAKNFIDAIAFAKDAMALDKNNKTKEPERINTATTNVVYYYKKLLKSAKLENLKDQIETAEASADWDSATVLGDGVIDMDAIKDVTMYSKKSYTAYLNALKDAYIALDADYSINEQAKVDEITEALRLAVEGLEEPTGEAEFSYAFNEEAIGEGFTTYGFMTWRPCINNVFDYEMQTYGEANAPTVMFNNEEVTANGYLYGLPYLATKVTLSSLFECDGCSVMVVPSVEPEEGLSDAEIYCGTGSLVFITDENQEECYAAYIVVYRTDVTGDCMYDWQDDDEISMFNAYFRLEWLEDPANLCRYMAMDLDGNLYYDFNDDAILSYYNAQDQSLDNGRWNEIWQPGGNGNSEDEPGYFGQYPYSTEIPEIDE